MNAPALAQHPMEVLNVTKATAEERFWAKVDKSDPGGCWLWTSAITPDGYGQFWSGEERVYAHRWAYEHFVGPIPPGLTIDHVRDRGCRHRHCVNFLDHLEPVTYGENIRRGDLPDILRTLRAQQIHCKNGHPLSGDNLTTGIRADGRTYRRCLRCAADSAKRRYDRDRA